MWLQLRNRLENMRANVLKLVEREPGKRRSRLREIFFACSRVRGIEARVATICRVRAALKGGAATAGSCRTPNSAPDRIRGPVANSESGPIPSAPAQWPTPPAGNPPAAHPAILQHLSSSSGLRTRRVACDKQPPFLGPVGYPPIRALNTGDVVTVIGCSTARHVQNFWQDHQVRPHGAREQRSEPSPNNKDDFIPCIQYLHLRFLTAEDAKPAEKFPAFLFSAFSAVSAVKEFSFINAPVRHSSEHHPAPAHSWDYRPR